MTIYFEHTDKVKTKEIILKKDGKIVLNKEGYKKKIIGTYSISYPKKEAKEKGLIAKEYVPRIYKGDIPYTGQSFGYSANDFKESVCNIINSKGIDI